jgi:hypothetical protein
VCFVKGLVFLILLFNMESLESIPLHSPRPLPATVPTPLPPPPPPEEKEEEETESPLVLLTAASKRIAALCAASAKWEIMETADPLLLCFSYRDRPRRYRIAGRLLTNAATLVAHLKDMPTGTVLLSTEHVRSYGENIERLRHQVHLPGPPLANLKVQIEGVQQCIFMEDSNCYLYVFVTEGKALPLGGGVSFLLGVRIHELDDDAGCEVEVVFEWEHLAPTLGTWASDRWLETFWLNSKNLCDWAQLFQ